MVILTLAPFESDIYNFNYFEKKYCTKNEIQLYKDLINIGFYDVFYEKIFMNTLGGIIE